MNQKLTFCQTAFAHLFTSAHSIWSSKLASSELLLSIRATHRFPHAKFIHRRMERCISNSFPTVQSNPVSRMFMQRSANVGAHVRSNFRIGESLFRFLSFEHFFKRFSDSVRWSFQNRSMIMVGGFSHSDKTRYPLVGWPLPVLPPDEYQAKQLVSSSALTKFLLSGEVFGKELRAKDKKVAALMHLRELESIAD